MLLNCTDLAWLLDSKTQKRSLRSLLAAILLDFFRFAIRQQNNKFQFQISHGNVQFFPANSI